MRLGFHPASVERGEADGFIDRQEQIVTVLAASTAIFVVAAIAVLMGMASRQATGSTHLSHSNRLCAGRRCA